MNKNKTATRSSITKEESQALNRQSLDKGIVVLPADKDQCTVGMDKSEYKDKYESMLQNSNTYKKFKPDPTINRN